MIGQMAIAVALPGFSNLWHSVTPNFLFDGSFFFRVSTFSKKSEENLLIRRIEFFAKITIEFCSV